jgi:hypothetical protein
MITGINVKKDANPLTKNEKKQIKKQINLMMDVWRKLKEMEQQKCLKKNKSYISKRKSLKRRAEKIENAIKKYNSKTKKNRGRFK